MALTAAHRTLPFQSVVRVTNLKTNSQVIVRINDRGPFVDGRVIDLSLAAAKALDMWHRAWPPSNWKCCTLRRPSTSAESGACRSAPSTSAMVALDLKQTLTARYRQARVLDFPGATGYWVRVLVQDDDRLLAQKVASNIKVSEGGVFLVRLD